MKTILQAGSKKSPPPRAGGRGRLGRYHDVSLAGIIYGWNATVVIFRLRFKKIQRMFFNKKMWNICNNLFTYIALISLKFRKLKKLKFIESEYFKFIKCEIEF
jgi:hypothetical protein